MSNIRNKELDSFFEKILNNDILKNKKELKDSKKEISTLFEESETFEKNLKTAYKKLKEIDKNSKCNDFNYIAGLLKTALEQIKQGHYDDTEYLNKLREMFNNINRGEHFQLNNYLQTIIKYVKKEGFNVDDVDKSLIYEESESFYKYIRSAKRALIDNDYYQVSNGLEGAIYHIKNKNVNSTDINIDDINCIINLLNIIGYINEIEKKYLKLKK